MFFLYLYSIDTRKEKLWLTSISIIAQSVELFNAIKQASASMKKTVIKFATAQSPRVTLVCSRVTKYVEVDIYFIKVKSVKSKDRGLCAIYI